MEGLVGEEEFLCFDHWFVVVLEEVEIYIIVVGEIVHVGEFDYY